MMRVLQAGWSPIGDWPVIHATNAGYFTADANAVTGGEHYIGGMPVGYNLVGATDGIGLVVGGQAEQCIVGQIALTANTAGASNLLGLLFNNALIDIRRGAGNKTETDISFGLPTIVPLPCYVEMWRGTPSNVDLPQSHDVPDGRAPFLEDAWAFGDPIFVEASATVTDNGRLTRTAGTPNLAAIGRCLKPPADDTETMIAMFWQPPEASISAA